MLRIILSFDLLITFFTKNYHFLTSFTMFLITVINLINLYFILAKFHNFVAIATFNTSGWAIFKVLLKETKFEFFFALITDNSSMFTCLLMCLIINSLHSLTASFKFTLKFNKIAVCFKMQKQF